MKRNDHFTMRTPLFFKLWFGFVVSCIIAVFFVTGYLLFTVASAGPEGIGRAIGAIVKGIDEGRK